MSMAYHVPAAGAVPVAAFTSASNSGDFRYSWSPKIASSSSFAICARYSAGRLSPAIPSSRFTRPLRSAFMLMVMPSFPTSAVSLPEYG